MSKLRLADARSFVTNPLPGNRIQVNTPLGKFVAESDDDVFRIGQETIQKMTERLGRAPSYIEAMSGPQPAEDRTMQQKIEFGNWEPKVTDSPHPMQQLADSLREGVGESDQYKGLSLNERLALDAERVVSRDLDQSEVDQARAAKLNKLAPQLKQVNELLDNEPWRGENGSQRLVDLATMLKRQLTDGNDPEEVKRLRGEIKNFLDDRARTEREKKRMIIEAMEREIARVKDGSQFADFQLTSDEIDERIEQLKSDEAELQAEQKAIQEKRAEIDSRISSEFTLTPEEQKQAQVEAHHQRAEQAAIQKAGESVKPL